MDTNGIVFICVMFAICLALISFCCLKFCTSEDKYERNPGSNSPPILPTSTADCTDQKKKKFIYFQAIPPYRPKSLPLDVGSNQVLVGNEPYVNSSYNLSSPPTPGFIVDAAQSDPCASILPCPPNPPPIGFEYPPDVINTDTTQSHCPYPTAAETKCRTPSPNLEIYKTSYSPRTSSYFSEKARPLSGISFSSENLDISSKPRPPSYIEAMREYELPAGMNSPKEQFSEYKPNR